MTSYSREKLIRSSLYFEVADISRLTSNPINEQPKRQCNFA